MRLGNALGIPEDVYRYEPDARLILPKDLVGLEFEFEGVKNEKPVSRDVATSLAGVKEGWASYWRIKADGSLHDQGCEFLFARPLFGADVIAAVTNLLAYAREKDYKVSIRTGLHVHVDVRDLTRDELARLNVLYALFEKAVYRLAGNNRDENVFCLPWYKADAMSNHVVKINSPHHDIRIAAEELANEKYGGLNLDTLARFGSVEFRHALATTDTEWVLKWINVCLSFKRAAKKLDMQPLDIIHNLSGVGPENLARVVFDDVYDIINYPDLAQDVWRTGVETALHVYPKQQEVIDAASLSWNRSKGKTVKVNPRFKAFVEKHAKKQELGVQPNPFAALNDNLFLAGGNLAFNARAFAQPGIEPAEPEPEPEEPNEPGDDDDWDNEERPMQDDDDDGGENA